MSTTVSNNAMDVDTSPITSQATPSRPRATEFIPPTNNRHHVGYVYSEEMTLHAAIREKDEGEHPEHPHRIARIYEALLGAGYINMMKKLPIRLCVEEEALLVHSEDLWEKVLAIKSMTPQDIVDSEAYYESLSLYVHESTPYCARLSCGATIEACLAVARDEVSKAFAIVRPPGHHAEPDEHMGFCFFNNVAVAAKVVQAQTPIKRIMILDWDVHHGNGTQKAFADDDSVLYVSIHRFDDGAFYPSTQYGSMLSVGDGKGTGFSVNVPWPKEGMGDADYLHAFHKIVMPIAMEFAPEMVIISAGFDAAEGDDLGRCLVTPSGYAHMTHMLAGLAGGRLAVALEGGYNLKAISDSALAVTRVLFGEAPPRLAPMQVSDIATDTIWKVAKVQSKWWKNVNPVECEPKEEYGPLAVPINKILKAHRQYVLSNEKHLSLVPMLLKPEVQRYLDAEAWCTSNIFREKTMVVLVHELGELKGDTQSAITVNLRQEKTFLVDFTREIVDWVETQGCSFIDINLLEVMPGIGEINPPKPKTLDQSKLDVVTYMWDNYIQISGAERIVFIGHGSGCQPILGLLQKRSASMMKCVTKIIQVIPHSTMLPRASKEPEVIRPWYFKHSAVFVPSTHRVFHETPFKSYGTLYPLGEEKPILLIRSAFPIIQSLVGTAFEGA